MKRNVFFALILGLIAMLVTGCSDNTPTNNDTALKITTFTAVPNTVAIGDSALLTWVIEGTATSLSIDNGVGDVTGKSSVAAHPAASTTYILTAKNASETVTASVTVTVNNPSDPGAPPNPTNLRAVGGSPGVINLDWGVSTGAARYEVERRGAAFVSIAHPVVNSYPDVGLFPGKAYTYRVRAVSASGARSGWSNFATAIAPGTAPVVAKVELVPTAPRTLKPGDTLQFHAIAYDASNNDLHFAQGIFAWQSSSFTIAAINDTGLVTAGTQQGLTSITASVGGVTSNAVSLNVALQENKVLVIYHPRAGEDFTIYKSALLANGIGFDEITTASGTQAPTFTFDLIKKYERIFYFTHMYAAINGQNLALLKQFLDQGGRQVVLMGEALVLSSDAAFRSYIGLQADGYMRIEKTAYPFTGQPGTLLAGFSFDRTGVTNFTSRLTLVANGNAVAALKATSTDASAPGEVIVGMQSTIGTSVLYYGGLTLENIPSSKQAEFFSRMMASW